MQCPEIDKSSQEHANGLQKALGTLFPFYMSSKAEGENCQRLVGA